MIASLYYIISAILYHTVLHYLMASPLPPAPLSMRWLVICRLKGFAGFERFTRLKTCGIQKYMIIVSRQFFIQIFQCLLLLEVLGRHFGWFGGPGKPLWDDFGDHVCKGAFREAHEGPRFDFFMIFNGFGDTHWGHIWRLFLMFLWFGVSKSRLGLLSGNLMTFLVENVMVYDVPTSQIWCKYWCFQ